MIKDLLTEEVSAEEYDMAEEFNTYERNTPNMEEIDMIYTEIQNELGGEADISIDITIESLTEETIVKIAVENVPAEKIAFVLDPSCSHDLNSFDQIEVLTNEEWTVAIENPKYIFYKSYLKCFEDIGTMGIAEIIVLELAVIDNFYYNNQSLIDSSANVRFKSFADKIDIIIQDDVDVQFLEAKRNARWDKNLSEELAIKLR